MSERIIPYFQNQVYLNECFRYEDGKLFWKNRPSHHFEKENIAKVVNKRHAGKEAGGLRLCNNKKGEKIWVVAFERQFARRDTLVWFMHHGEWHRKFDHINGDKLDDRIENLIIAEEPKKFFKKDGPDFVDVPCIDCGKIRRYNKSQTTPKRLHPRCYECNKCPHLKKSTVTKETQKERRKTIIAQRIAEGKCYNCHSPRMNGNSHLCEKHWFISMASAHLGSGTVADGQFLKDLFDKQGGRCAYTGIPVKPGFNCSFDHKFPKSRYPELKHARDNIQIVDDEVNRVKTFLTHDEFITLCEVVVMMDKAKKNIF